MKNMYERLSGIRPLAKSYTFKFLFIAFLGIHIPLIGLIVFTLFKPDRFDKFSIIVLTLLLTLAATAVTLYILNGLLMPLRRSGAALLAYRVERTIPELPTHYPDEAGQLMRNVQCTITEMDELLEEKRDLTSLLSHDLRIPLQNVKTFAKLIRQEADEPETVREMSAMVLESAEEQTRMLENILQMLRQEQLFFGNKQGVKTDTVQVVEQTVANLETLAAQKGVRLKKDIRYGGTVDVHPDLLSQVLKNLATNAIKFSHQNTEVSFCVYEKNGKVVIDVKDSGLGFEPAVAERLFDRFTKAGRVGTAGEPSTGIGLYLSRKIIRHHRGELTAHSEGKDKGSVFTVSLN